MKKILNVIVVSVLSFCIVGCGGVSKNKVELVEQNDLYIAKYMDNAESTFSTTANEHSTWFEFTGKEFIDALNEKMAEKEYKPLVGLKKDEERMFTYNNSSWYILTDTRSENELEGKGMVEEIELSLFTLDETDAKRNGDYIYGIIETLSPGLSEQVCEELGIFGDNSEGMPSIRRILCGNQEYVYVDNGDTTPEFYVFPYAEYVEEETVPNAIKPE